MRELAKRGASLSLIAAALVAIMIGLSLAAPAAAVVTGGGAGLEAFRAALIEGRTPTLVLLGLDLIFILVYSLLLLTMAAQLRRSDNAPMVNAMLIGLGVLAAADISENLVLLSLVQAASLGPETAARAKDLAEFEMISSIKWVAAAFTVAASSFLPPGRSLSRMALAWGARVVVPPAAIAAIVSDQPVRFIAGAVATGGLVLLFVLLALMFRRIERAGLA